MLLLVFVPTFSSHQRDKPDFTEFFLTIFLFAFSSYSNQLLECLFGAYRNYHAPADLQLLVQRLGHLGPTGGDDDGVKGGIFLISFGTITGDYDNIVVSQFS